MGLSKDVSGFASAVSLIIATGSTPTLAIGTICPYDHHNDLSPVSYPTKPVEMDVNELAKLEKDKFILFTLTEPLNDFPSGSTFAINIDYIIAAGPAAISTTPDFGLVTPLINGTSLSIGGLTEKTAVVLNSVMDDTTEGYYSVLHPSKKKITFTTSLSSATPIVQTSNPLTLAVKPSITACNSLQISTDMKLRRQEEKIIAERWPIRQKAAFSVAPPEIGTQTAMYIDGKDGKTVLTQVQCIYISTQGNFWVNTQCLNSSVLTTAAIQALADFWDNTVYSKDTAIFGMPADTDGDPRIDIVFSPLERYLDNSFVVGYFSPTDKFPRNNSTNPYSNERDMFYLTIPQDDWELSLFKGTLAHEFQHMINFDQHYKAGISEKIWINEGMSELADALCTGTAQSGRDVSDFLNNPISLTIWCYNGTTLGEPWDMLLNYSASRLFALYLYDRFVASGVKPDLLRNLDSGQYGVGMQGVANTTDVPFNQLFEDWITALYLSNRGITSDPKYNYTSINLQSEGYTGLRLGSTLNIGSTASVDIYPYSMAAFPLQGITGTSKFTLSGTAAGGLIVGY